MPHILESGRIYATGNNKYGQLGLGMKRSICIPMPIRSLEAQKITKISCWNHSACLTARGELYIWGTGVFGEYLNPVRFSKGGIVFKELSVGNFFGAAIENNGRLWVWGSNTGGELGLGDYDSRVKPVLNEHLKSKKGWKLSCGGNFVIVLGEIIKRRRVLSSTSPLRVTTGNFGEEGLYKTPQRKPFENIEQKIEPSAVMRTSLEDIIPIKSLIQRSDGRSLFDENRTSKREGLIGRSTGRGRNTGREFIGTLKRSLERGERISDVDLSEVRKRENLLGEQKVMLIKGVCLNLIVY